MKKTTKKSSKTEKNKKARQDAFLKEYRLCATITHAAEIALISRRTHYLWIEKDSAYAAAFEEAKVAATDALVKEARRRATQGVKEPVYYKGEVVAAGFEEPDKENRQAESVCTSQMGRPGRQSGLLRGPTVPPRRQKALEPFEVGAAHAPCSQAGGRGGTRSADHWPPRTGQTESVRVLLALGTVPVVRFTSNANNGPLAQRTHVVDDQ